MTINYTALLGLAEPVTGTESGTWGDDVNKGITDYLDIAIAGTNTLSTDADVTLTQTQGASAGSNISATTAQYMQLLCSGARTAIRNITVPATSKIYVVNNATTGGYAVVVKTGVSTGVSIANSEKAVIAYNGSDFVKIASSLISGLTGTLPVANGGTGATTLSGVVYGNGTSAMTAATGAQISTAIGATFVTNATNATTATNLAGGAAYQVPYQSGAGATTYITAPSVAGTVLGWSGTALGWVSAPAATTATNLSGGGAYTVVYQSSAGTTAYLTNGTTGQILTANTSGAPSWANASTNATNLSGGSAGVVPYQSATGTTLFTAVGTSGYYLQSNGTGAPTWTAVNALPSQTGNSGKFLTTDGSNASWAYTGASAGGVIWENSTSISSNYTLTTSKNGLSVGPITIASGVAVTVPSGQRWVIL
jgi:hypothetical protein